MAQEPDKPRGIRVGLDLSRYGFYIMNKGFLSNEITVDYNWKENNFLVIDVGTISGSEETEKYLVEANGFYSRIGIDRNFLPHPADMLSFGTRFGMSVFTYNSSNIVFSDPVWGDYTDVIDPQKMSAFWVEAVFGIKTEIFTNIFLGWSASAKVMLVKARSEYFPEVRVPGYGSQKGSFSPGFGFYIIYRLPFSRKSKINN